MKNEILSFEDTSINLIYLDNERWITAENIGKALRCEHALKSIDKLYRANKDEFKGTASLAVPSLTKLIKIKSAGGEQNHPCF